ncbi:hypothetical protein [Nocardia altamirensis]|uniref:hypothetical protein n=1 Tax=Nocardia altamirensis TaxID=472158 RepID=UPI000840884A|nr:hypothetical protein [Nocardia altamirensis]
MAVMDGMRTWAVVTAAAVLVVQVVDLAARLLVDPGWIFVFLFVFGAPVWLMCLAASGWMARGMFSATSSFAAAGTVGRSVVLTLLWVYLVGLTAFCWFMPDGGDADDWQSPAGRLLGVDGYNSRTPEYLNVAQSIAVPAMGIGLVALFAASIVYASLSSRAAAHALP